MKFTPHEMSVLVFIAQRPDFLAHYISSLGVEARQVAEFLAGSPPASSAVEAAGLGIRADAARRRLVAEVDSPAELAAANPPDEHGQRLSRSSCFCSCCCGFEPDRTPTARNDCTCKLLRRRG